MSGENTVQAAMELLSRVRRELLQARNAGLLPEEDLPEMVFADMHSCFMASQVPLAWPMRLLKTIWRALTEMTMMRKEQPLSLALFWELGEFVNPGAEFPGDLKGPRGALVPESSAPWSDGLLVNRFAILDQLVAEEISRGVLHKGTALAVLMMLRDALAPVSGGLVERMRFSLTEAAGEGGR